MNKRERMKAAFEKTQMDCLPAAFWHHFDARDPKDLIEGHVDFFKKTDMDFIKIMYEYMFNMPDKVEKVSDWYKIKPKGKDCIQYKNQVEIIKGVLDRIGSEAMSFTTMFNSMKMAAWCVGDAGLMAHIKEDKQAVKHALNVFSEVLTEWMDGFLETGLDGIFYSAQFGEVGRFDKSEWSELVEPYDKKLLNHIKSKDKYIMLHLCGEPEFEFKVHIDRYANYPMDMINWAIHANNYELERGIDLFNVPVMGGLDNRGIMVNGDFASLDSKIEQLHSKYSKHGFVLGADCSVQEGYQVELMAHAIQKAHSIKAT